MRGAMTKQEHALMIGLLAMQLELVQALAQILESRDILSQDDVNAFLAIRTPSERKEMTEKARLIYASIAQKVGIDIAAEEI
jgi:hypothetical protein